VRKGGGGEGELEGGEKAMTYFYCQSVTDAKQIGGWPSNG